MVWRTEVAARKQARANHVTKLVSRLGCGEAWALSMNVLLTQRIFPKEITNNLENNQERHSIAVNSVAQDRCFRISTSDT